MKNFEYQTLFFKSGLGKAFQNHDDELNKMGREGWDCVNSSPFVLNGTHMGMSYLFKRELIN